MRRAAVLAFPDHTGEPAARLQLERDAITPNLCEPYRGTAAWLMCNPSTADAHVDDPTAQRVMHHSLRLGCARVLVGNVWGLRTPYPADLWEALRNGRYTPEMHEANLDALAIMGAQADVFVVAFGAAPWRSHRAACLDALRVWAPTDGRVPLCLGTTDDGAPLHPLARGKFAVRNDCQPYDWPGGAAVVKRVHLAARLEQAIIAARTARARERAAIVAYLRHLDEPQLYAAADLIEAGEHEAPPL